MGKLLRNYKQFECDDTFETCERWFISTLAIYMTVPLWKQEFIALRKYVRFRWKTKRKNQWRFVVWRHTIGNSLEESTCNDAEMNRPVGRMDGVEIRRICTFFFAHESNINQTFVFKVFEDFVSWYLLDF